MIHEQLPQWAWRNIDISKIHRGSGTSDVDDRRKEILSFVSRIALSCLTDKQMAVFRKYIQGWTQNMIANNMGLSQPTINQHLFGKRRHGKQVGGSICRIRKALRRMKDRGDSNSSIVKQAWGVIGRLSDRQKMFRARHSRGDTMSRALDGLLD
jgi:predicted transcriptional regulator